MSTQQTVTSRAIAAPRAAALLLAHWAWLLGCAACALTAAWAGVPIAPLTGAAALAATPALAGFVLLPWVARRRVAAGLLLVWGVSALGLTAGTGGVNSALAMMFVVPPSLALALGRRWAPEAGAVCVLGYALAAALSASTSGASLAPFPEIMAVLSLAMAAALMALGQNPGTAPGDPGDAGRRIAEVSHELRTPLTHILGFSEMIERRIFGELNERYVEYAGLIRKSGNHLLALVNDVLDLSRAESGRLEVERERFDVRAIIEEVVREAADAAEKKHIALAMVTPETPLMLNADPMAVRRMLINTLGNALKFTPEGGRVIVQAALQGGAVVLDTIDNGPGIAEDDRAKIGVAYERGSGGARAEGTGLGLSLVRALAGLHGGALSFHDAPGGGALVRIKLPETP